MRDTIAPALDFAVDVVTEREEFDVQGAVRPTVRILMGQGVLQETGYKAMVTLPPGVVQELDAGQRLKFVRDHIQELWDCPPQLGEPTP